MILIFTWAFSLSGQLKAQVKTYDVVNSYFSQIDNNVKHGFGKSTLQKYRLFAPYNENLNITVPLYDLSTMYDALIHYTKLNTYHNILIGQN